MTSGTEGPHWVKSSLSFANGNCVEVSDLGGEVGVRNSRDREGPVLRFTPDEWHAFLGGVMLGEFDRFGGEGEPATVPAAEPARAAYEAFMRSLTSRCPDVPVVSWERLDDLARDGYASGDTQADWLAAARAAITAALPQGARESLLKGAAMIDRDTRLRERLEALAALNEAASRDHLELSRGAGEPGAKAEHAVMGAMTAAFAADLREALGDAAGSAGARDEHEEVRTS